ncbi:protein myomixer-like [Oncorhynchus keta]|uniref:Myomixer n=3 Tax=Oncorhynchus TaxID=8016 RepID=A0A8C7N1W2_ONCKI|nr:protein myomixer-like [Oncorhynchus keta]QII57370.1 myomixer [Oncorhynchus mykiss]
MPAVFLLLRTLLSSRLIGSLLQFLRRTLSSTFSHVGAALRYVWDRISSQESKEAILGCVLCLLNMHKKVDQPAADSH